MSTAFSVGSKTLNKKITKHEKTISIAEAKRLSVSRLFSKAIETNSISDIEFNSILHEIEQYKSLKRHLKYKANISSEVDVDAIREQIKEDYRKKTRITRKHNEIRIEFDEKPNGFFTVYIQTEILKTKMSL